MTAQWHVDGPAAAGAATLDAVFQSVMTAQQIRAASVAIASGRTIYEACVHVGRARQRGHDHDHDLPAR